MTTRVRLTYEDYAALPDDGRRYELHEGELSVTPAPGVDHQETLAKLFVILWGHVKAGGLGKLLFAPWIASSRTSPSFSPTSCSSRRLTCRS